MSLGGAIVKRIPELEIGKMPFSLSPPSAPGIPARNATAEWYIHASIGKTTSFLRVLGMRSAMHL